MDTAHVKDILSIKNIKDHPAAARHLARAATEAPGSPSAETLLKAFNNVVPGSSVSGQMGQAIGNAMGIKAKTEKGHSFNAPYAYLTLGLMCACAQRGFTIKSVNEFEAGRSYMMVAEVPSNIFSWAGQASFEVSGTGGAYEISGKVVFAGQLMDMGRGRRLLESVFADTEAYVRRFESEGL